MNAINEHSQWRIELAEELSTIYSDHEQVKIVVLGGSPSRGLSDQYSDMDVIIYWDKFDEEFIDSHPLKPIAGNPRLFLDHRQQGSMMELYNIDTLIFEVGHMTLESWSQMVDLVINKHDINPMIQKSLGGFLDSKVIYGEELAELLKSEIRVYPEELARRMIQRNLGFFWRGCIEHQGLDRGETVFFYEALCQSVKRLLGLLSGLNKRYFAVYEPRWIEYELDQMKVKPDRMWQRIKELYSIDPYEAVVKLYELLDEVMVLVRKKYPDLDYSTFDDCDKLLVQATPHKPSV